MSEDETLIDKKEKLLIECLISEVEVFVQCYGIVDQSYFKPPLNRVVDFINKFFVKHKNIPNVDIIEAETGVALKEREMDRGDHSYFIEEIEEHCQGAAMIQAVLAGADLIDEGNAHGVIDLVKKAMLVRLDRSIGTDLMENAKERISTMDDRIENFSTGINEIDEMIGKLRRQEFGMVYAVSSGGKSVMLANIADALYRQNLDVVVITLELKEDLYAKRMDAMMAGVDIGNHQKFAAKVDDYYTECKDTYDGSIILKKMPAGTTASQIDAYLLDYSLQRGKYPDALIVDYLGLMGTEDKKNTNKFDLDHEKSMGILQMGETYDMITISAGQINRDGYDVVKINPSHCAGGISVINNSDWSIGLVATEEDIDNNQAQVVAMKIRNASRSSTPIMLYRNPTTLKFTTTPEGKKVLTGMGEKRDNKNVSGSEEKSKTPKSVSSKSAKLKAALNLK